MTVLVIGGCGYIGSALVDRLASENVPTTVWDLDVSTALDKPCVNYQTQDFLLADDQAFRMFDTVVLLAGYSSVTSAERNPQGALRTNAEGLCKVLRAAKETFVMYASSASVYDGSAGSQAAEEFPLATPRNVYDLTKQVGDAIASMYGNHWLGLRFGTVNGVSRNMRIDLIINRMVKTALEIGQVEIANGHVSRGILAIEDLVEFMMNQIASPPPVTASGLVNLASFNSTVRSIGEEVASRLNAEVIEMPASSTYDFSLACNKAASIFGFKPSVTLAQLVDELRRFYLSR